MSTHTCCSAAAGACPQPRREAERRQWRRHRHTIAKRCTDFAGWLIPSTILLVLPKCPMCMAAYIALGTGLSLSLSAANCVRTGLIVLCVASLAFAGFGLVRRRRAARITGLHW